MSRDMTLPRIVRGHVEAEPERVFLTMRDLKAAQPGTPAPEHVMRYGELWDGASALAQGLHGLPRGARALLVMPIGTRLLQAHLGVQLAAGIPIIHSHPSDKVEREVYLRHLAHVIALLQPQAILTTRDFAQAVRAASPGPQCRVIIEEDVAARSDYVASAWQDVAADECAIIQHSALDIAKARGAKCACPKITTSPARAASS